MKPLILKSQPFRTICKYYEAEKYLAEILATVSIQAMIWPPKVFPWWFAWGGWTSSILCTWVRSVETASSSSKVSKIRQQCINELFQLVTDSQEENTASYWSMQFASDKMKRRKKRKTQKTSVLCKGSKSLKIYSVLPRDIRGGGWCTP